MNFINLIENIKSGIDYNAFNVLYNDFMDNYRDNYRKARYTKSTAEKAVNRYVNGTATMKGEKTATYTDGTTVLFLSKEPENAKDLKPAGIEEQILDLLKTRRPASCYFVDSIVLYKTLKRQENKTYFLHIDGNYYNAEKVAEMIDCITTEKENYISAEICENGALFIRQTDAALILPVKRDTIHASDNVNMYDFLKHFDAIEKSFIDEIARTA